MRPSCRYASNFPVQEIYYLAAKGVKSIDMENLHSCQLCCQAFTPLWFTGW